MGDKNLPTVDNEFEYTPKMVRELKKCAKDIIHFAKNYFTIVSLSKGKTLINLYAPQKKVLKKIMNNRFSVILSSRQCGKALDLNTPIPTDNGWTTMGNIKTNDYVLGPDGKRCKVTKAHDILYNRNCYKIFFDNGETIVADEDHLWATQTLMERRIDPRGFGSIKTTKDIYNTLNLFGCSNHRIKMARAIEGTPMLLPIEPYLLGSWLGDGSSSNASIYTGSDDLNEMVANLNQPNINITKDSTNTYRISIRKHGDYCLSTELNKNNLYKNKHIPSVYLNASIEQRMELLRGIMDTDGYISKKGHCDLRISDETLAQDCISLIRGLGYKVHVKKIHTKYGGKRCKDAYRMLFTTTDKVFKLKRKLDRLPLRVRADTQHHYITNIKRVESRPVRCITVDNKDNLFLCGSQYIPTHNTTMITIYALWYTCFNPDKRILIVANKESTAIMILRRIRMAYELLPNWLKPGVKQWGKTEVIFGNDSSVSISTTTSSAARGESINCLLIDECAHIPEHIMKEFWSSVIPVISSSQSTKIVVVSSANGTNNKFYDLYSKAESGESKQWVHGRIDWFELPGRGKLWERDMRDALAGSGQDFDQEFGNSFLERRSL